MNYNNWTSQLYVDEYSIAPYHGHPDSYLTRLFPKSTMKVFKHEVEKHKTIVGFEINSDHLIQIMDIYGITLQRAEKAFYKALNELLIMEENNVTPMDTICLSYPDQDAFRTRRSKIECLSRIQFN